MQPVAPLALDRAAIERAALEDLDLARSLLVEIITADESTPAERARALASLARLDRQRAKLAAR